MERMMKRPTEKELQKLVDGFNASYPVGTPCILRKDGGEVETEVREPAYVMGGHSAVAFFKGVGGCYSIENIRVLPLPPSHD